MKILFGVFELGLGHATRDLPLIKELLKRKNEVHIISTSRSLKLLKDTFKDKCKYYDIPGIYPIYNKKFFKLGFIFNSIKLIKSLKIAREKSSEIIKNEKYDIIISDCRIDVYDSDENSFLINHQLRLKAPLIGNILEKWLCSRMKKYKFVIVPDYKGKNLSGNLSHNLKYFPEEKIKYIGILSHFEKSSSKNDIDYFISLSGPDKTRIELEKKIIRQIKDIDGKIVIAGGNPDIEKKDISKNIHFHSFLESKKQGEMMNRAKFIIIRAGYTTIMELAELEKNALLIPSPGQTEQEYLCDYLEKQGNFHHVSQSKLNLKKDIEIAKQFQGFNPEWKTKDAVKRFMNIIFEK